MIKRWRHFTRPSGQRRPAADRAKSPPSGQVWPLFAWRSGALAGVPGMGTGLEVKVLRGARW
jgi:hypothetical protein